MCNNFTNKIDSFIAFIRNYYSEKINPIYLHEPRFVGNERKYVIDAIDSTFVSSVGKYVDKFEEMMKEITGAKYATATVNGTAALHISLVLAGVERDDLVVTQPLSFIATCNAISYIGAKPVFVDVDLDTLGLCPIKLAEFLKNNCEVRNNVCYHIQSNKRISACVPMHTFGFPSKIDEIANVCAEFNIKLVEDAAESIGSKYKDKHTGTYGFVGAFSFNGNKTVTSGGGGCVITDDDRIGKLAKHLTTQAKIPHKWDFAHDYVGYNYRMPNINAALACAQLEMLERYIIIKRDLANQYKVFFETNEIQFVSEPVNTYSNYWLNSILLSNREERELFLEYTNNKKIMTRPVWNLMNKLKMFSNCICSDISNAIYIEDRLVNIPSSVKL